MGRHVQSGDTFEPTEIDAGYYIAHHMAADPPAKAEPDAPRRRGRPPQAAAPVAEPPANAEQASTIEQTTEPTGFVMGTESP